MKSDEKAVLFDAAMEQAGVTKVGVFGGKSGEEDSNSATRYVLPPLSRFTVVALLPKASRNA